MDRGVAVVLTAAVGGLIALQAPVMSLLGHRTGTVTAAAVSFAIGTVALIGIALLSGGLGDVAEVRSVPWYYLIGGLLGAAYVTCVLVTVRTLGAGGLTAARRPADDGAGRRPPRDPWRRAEADHVRAARGG